MLYKNPLTYVVFILFIILLVLNLEVDSSQHFIALARSFLSGRLSFIVIPKNISDLAYFNGKYYWPLGPFPAVILLPFVAIFKNFYQGFISFPLSIINFYFLTKIATILGLDKKRSILLATFFVFGSIYFPVASLPGSWYFAQTVACTLLILSIYEFLTKKRYLLIGTAIAFALATRLTLITSVIFFLYFLFKKPLNATNLAKFFIPILIAFILLGIYNLARFQNPLEQGYNYQIIPQEAQERRSVGLFSLKHVPANIYYMLFKGPEGIFTDNSRDLKFPYLTFDSYGLSIFFLSPILFLMFFADLKKELVKISAAASLLTLIPIITYYGIGQRQVGYRYALDFLPFIFLILAGPARKLKLKYLYFLVFWGVFFSVYFSILYLAKIMV